MLMMSGDHFIAINSEKTKEKGKMLKHLFWSTIKIKSKSLSAADFLKNQQIIITWNQVSPHIQAWNRFMQKFLF